MLVRSMAFAVLAIAAATPSFADPAQHRQLADEFLVEIKADQMLQQARMQGIESQKKLFRDAAATPGGEDRIRRTLVRMNELLDREMSWESCKSEFIDLYTKTFSEDELKELLAFYRSPTGKKYVAKFPEIMGKSSEIVRRKMVAVVPELQKLAREGKEQPEKLRIPGMGPPPTMPRSLLQRN